MIRLILKYIIDFYFWYQQLYKYKLKLISCFYIYIYLFSYHVYRHSECDEIDSKYHDAFGRHYFPFINERLCNIDSRYRKSSSIQLGMPITAIPVDVYFKLGLSVPDMIWSKEKRWKVFLVHKVVYLRIYNFFRIWNTYWRYIYIHYWKNYTYIDLLVKV